MYMDRHGTYHTPKESDTVRDRDGAFAIILSEDKTEILVTAGPHAPDVPELPGGGIDKGENAETAVVREIFEETNQKIDKYKIEHQWNFDLKFYADDVDEYWDYKQTMFQISVDLEHHFFDGKVNTPEGGYSWWMALSDIDNEAFRATDKFFLKQIGYLPC